MSNDEADGPNATAPSLPDEALAMQSAAVQRGVRAAIAGSVAVHLGCPNYRDLFELMGRRPMHDIDFWALKADEHKIESLFRDRGYAADPSIMHMREWGIKRLIFEHEGYGIKVDVFLDELVMAHTIPFRERLRQGAGPLVPMTDLLLSKLQIHEITANDLIDLFVILRESATEVELDGPRVPVEKLDVDYLQRTLCADWGFWYDARENLLHLRDVSDTYVSVAERHRVSVVQEIERVIGLLDTGRKSSGWKRRSWLGTKSRWYEIVREVSA